MAAKRSPILGYNHNVRYRGIVFHVQTEDSGVVNPHVFSHLFHGGVIISTRKIVYDPDAAEDVVKSLMQAQHKAMMKDLKNRFFDDKIDQYLGGTAGLLPREGAGEPTPPAAPEAAPVPLAVTQEPSEPVIELIDGAKTIPIPVVHDDGPIARAATEPVNPQALAAFEGAALPPPSGKQTPVAKGLSRTDISEALNAIQVGDDELAAAGLVEVEDVVQVHSPAPPGTQPPPGAQPERPGQYSVKRGSGPIEKLERPGPTGAPPRPPIPKPTPPSNKLPTSGVPPRPQTGQQAAVQPPGTTPPPVAVPRPPVAGQGPSSITRPTPPAVPRIPPGSPVPRPGNAPAPAPRSRAPSGGGVVVSRPPVIVGGPSKAVGTPSGQGKVRRAKDTDGGIGGDLISERSLDEVILAYLSEDTSDE